MTSYLKTFFYLICLSCISANAAEPSWNAEVALPADSKITIRWVLPPGKSAIQNRAKLYNLKFSVGPDGSPWIGYNHKYLLNPEKKYFLEFPVQYNDMILLDNDALLISTQTEFGYPLIRKISKESPVVEFQPIAGLPIPGCRMFKGTNNCVYFSGFNPTNSQYEVYLLKPEKLGAGDANAETIEGYKKVFSCPEKIDAVAGDGNVTFISIGNTILGLPEDGSGAKKLFTHPAETVKQLWFNKRLGLFYATESRAGYLGSSGQLEFFKGEKPQISMSGNNLYIFCENDFGIVAFDNIDDLSRMNFQIVEPASSLMLGIGLVELLIILFFVVALTTLILVVSIRRRCRINPPAGNHKVPAANQERNEIMSNKLYVKPPKGILIAQIIIVPLFMLFGLSFVFLAEGEAVIFVIMFVFIWETACIAILANAIKLLRQGKLEIAEMSGVEDIKEEDFSRKLRDIESLKKDGLLSDDEYRRKREEILNKKW